MSYCSQAEVGSPLDRIDFRGLTSMEDSIPHVLITSPVGSSFIYSYDDSKNQIELMDSILYMPFPVNEGLVVGTQDENGKPLRCLILGKKESQGDVIRINPIALMHRNEGDKEQKWILAVPNKASQQVVQAINLYDLLTTNQSILVQLENWFSYYLPVEGSVQVIWTSENDAFDLMKKKSIY